jgi:hypothetical protein
VSASWAAVAEELIAIPAPAFAPPGIASVVELALGFDEPGSLLIVGAPLPDQVRRNLWPQLAVRQVLSLGDALEAMDAQEWKLIIVSPNVRETSDGIRFVHAFKASKPLDGVAGQLRRRYAKVPFLIQPLPGDTEFAVFKSTSDWSLRDVRKTPLVSAIRHWCR